MCKENDLVNDAITNMSCVNKKSTLTREQQYGAVVKWWQSQEKNTVEDYTVLLDNFKIIFACNSSNIEGNAVSYHTTREVFTDGTVNNFSGSLRDLFEVRNQKFAFNAIINSLINSVKIDKEFILRIHKILLYGTYDDIRWSKGERPGTFKVNDYCVGSIDTGSYPDEVEEDIDSLVKEINTTDGDILTIASYMHLQFESIHPFADGNGRLGRLLLNYYLMLHNYPPVVIFDEDKSTYYMTLELWDRTGKLDGFKEFLIEETLKTWKRKIPEK